MRRYQANGFIPIGNRPPRVTRLAADVNIKKGDALHDDGSGYATNATTSFAGTFLGIAAAPVNNSGGDGLSVEIFSPEDRNRFIVPVANNALITRDDVGTYCDLENNDDIDISENLTEGYAFFIEDIDVSADAIAANTFGYAIGRIRVLGTQA